MLCGAIYARGASVRTVPEEAGLREKQVKRPCSQLQALHNKIFKGVRGNSEKKGQRTEPGALHHQEVCKKRKN